MIILKTRMNKIMWLLSVSFIYLKDSPGDVVAAFCLTQQILILDEATAAIDNETSEKIQRSLQREFSDMTLLIIAHRLHTVQHCDKIMVMDMGRVRLLSFLFETSLGLIAKGLPTFMKSFSLTVWIVINLV